MIGTALSIAVCFASKSVSLVRLEGVERFVHGGLLASPTEFHATVFEASVLEGVAPGGHSALADRTCMRY